MTTASCTASPVENESDDFVDDVNYFDSYARYRIHEKMLRDSVRTNAYHAAICGNPHLFKDKTVLDVGAGTGILSLFAAKAGAKRVFAVEYSDMALNAEKIVRDNHFDKVITVIHKKMEAIHELPDGVDKVDVIVSEWMGACLLFESMLNTVIYARDRFLKTDGILMPDRARLYISAIEDGKFKKDYFGWFDKVYGFNFRSFAEGILADSYVKFVEPDKVVTNDSVILNLDLYKTKVKDLAFTTRFVLVGQRTDRIDALMCHFAVDFTKGRVPISISTSPMSEQTHWAQFLFYLANPIKILRHDILIGHFSVYPDHRDVRNLHFSVGITVDDDSTDSEAMLID